ncbi:MAG: hypothetical protein Q8Q33_10895, partial [Chlamydiota bacterium]|nr:hypothetical protein [Chlamydiota bacterium]
MRLLQKTLSILLAISLTLDWSMVAPFGMGSPAIASEIPHISTGISMTQKVLDLELPNMQIEKIWDEGRNDICLIMVRDLHCQHEAQLHIARAIEQMNQKLGMSHVFVEGAEGPVRLDLYSSFPDKSIRTNVGNEFLKEGYITGPEFAALKGGLNMDLQIIGIENTKTYIDNLKTYRDVHENVTQSQTKLQEIQNILDRIIQQKYSSTLMKLHQIRRLIDSNDNVDWISVLESLKHIQIQNHKTLDPQLDEFLSILTEAQKLDEKSIQEQRDEFMRKIEKGLVKEDLNVLISANIRYRLGHISTAEYMSQMQQMYASRIGDFSLDFPMLNPWYQLEKRKDQLHVSSLIERIGGTVEQMMFDIATNEGT